MNWHADKGTKGLILELCETNRHTANVIISISAKTMQMDWRGKATLRAVKSGVVGGGWGGGGEEAT